MSTGCKIIDQSSPYFCTLTIVQWADIFTRQIYRDIVADSLNYCIEKKGLQVHAYVFMSNHIHSILSAANNNLSNIVRDIKSFTAMEIFDQMQSDRESRRDWLNLICKYAAGGSNRNKDFQIWTHDNHPEEIWSTKFLHQKLNYLHMNPVKAGLVNEPQHWKYSSALDYYCGKQTGPVQVNLLEL